MDTLTFLIKGGKMLELVKEHISTRIAVAKSNMEIANSVGAVSHIIGSSGNIFAVEFKGDPHPDFKKPSRALRGMCQPKKGTESYTKFENALRYKSESKTIYTELNVPLVMNYKRKSEVVGVSSGLSSGHQRIGYPLNECGFLYMGEDGPYAFWIPDVQRHVALKEADGYIVEDPAKSFKPEFDGCTQIEDEEWDIIFSKYKLKQKKLKAALTDVMC
jgi:hypothetical protein